MKYVALFICVFLLTAFLTFNVLDALSSDVPSSSNNSQYLENTTRKPVTKAPETEAPSISFPPIKDQTTKAPETEALEIAKGTREDPLPFGETGIVTGIGLYDYTEEVTITEVLRGKEANKLAKRSSWNDEPGEGEEWVICKVKIKALSADDNPGSNFIHASYFDFVDPSGVVYEYRFIHGQDVEFQDIYPGGTTEGYIGNIVPKGEKLLIAYYYGHIWFGE